MRFKKGDMVEIKADRLLNSYRFLENVIFEYVGSVKRGDITYAVLRRPNSRFSGVIVNVKNIEKVNRRR